MVFFVKKERVEVIFAGLGNPGVEYEATKHNVGFRAIDAFAAGHFPGCKFIKRVGSHVLKDSFEGHDILLAKPQQYMNNSGLPVKWLSRKYPADDIIVIYDDLDLPPGRIRLARSGRAAGHRGMQSIISSLRSDEIKRIRIGIGGRGDVDGAEYVLSPFTGIEAERVENAVAIAVKAMEEIVNNGFDRAMNAFNRRDIGDILIEKGDLKDSEIPGT